VLYLDGPDLRGRPIEDRKMLLGDVVGARRLRAHVYVDHDLQDRLRAIRGGTADRRRRDRIEAWPVGFISLAMPGMGQEEGVRDLERVICTCVECLERLPPGRETD